MRFTAILLGIVRSRWFWRIVGLLLIAEFTRRFFETADCWVTSRYSSFLIRETSGYLWWYCTRLHLLFPVGYFLN